MHQCNDSTIGKVFQLNKMKKAYSNSLFYQGARANSKEIDRNKIWLDPYIS